MLNLLKPGEFSEILKTAAGEVDPGEAADYLQFLKEQAPSAASPADRLQQLRNQTTDLSSRLKEQFPKSLEVVEGNAINPAEYAARRAGTAQSGADVYRKSLDNAPRGLGDVAFDLEQGAGRLGGKLRGAATAAGSLARGARGASMLSSFAPWLTSDESLTSLEGLKNNPSRSLSMMAGSELLPAVAQTAAAHLAPSLAGGPAGLLAAIAGSAAPLLGRAAGNLMGALDAGPHAGNANYGAKAVSHMKGDLASGHPGRVISMTNPEVTRAQGESYDKGVADLKHGLHPDKPEGAAGWLASLVNSQPTHDFDQMARGISTLQHSPVAGVGQSMHATQNLIQDGLTNPEPATGAGWLEHLVGPSSPGAQYGAKGLAHIFGAAADHDTGALDRWTGLASNLFGKH